MKKITLALLSVIMVVSQIFVVGAAKNVDAAEVDGVSDLVILQNVPEVTPEINENKIDLQAINVYQEGHFMLVSEDLSWKSSNKTVANVDETGKVTFSGKNGRTFITVTDGEFTDRIALDFKVNPKKAKSKGKPTPQLKVVKQSGERYDIITNAIEEMTIKEKLGQMLMPDFRSWNGEYVTEMLPEIEQLVKDYDLGGVILFRENVVTTEQTAKLVSAYQEASEKYGLLLTVDQEGGIVTRLQSGTDMPGNMALGATRSEEITRNVGRVIGEELEALGINMNLAPVLDVNINPDNPVIGVRSFSEDPQLVADLGVAYVEGLQSTGVAATGKHFPGHGDTAVDSHIGLPEVPHDIDRLKEVELYPFQTAMDAGIDAVMTAHVTFPKIDDTKVISKKDGTEIALPATLSHKVLTGLMREEMGYDGLIITDALNMGAIQDHFGPVDAAIRAVKAGTDVILMPVGLESVANGLYEAVETGEISESRIEESVERILTLKVKRGIIKEETPLSIEEKIANAQEVVGSAEHKQIEKEAAERSVTLVKNDDVLPLQLNQEDKVAFVGDNYEAWLVPEIQAQHDNIIFIQESSPLTDAQLAQLDGVKAIITGTYSVSESSSAAKMVRQMVDYTNAPVIAIGIRNPYDIMAYPEVDAYLAQYGFRDASFTATVETIFGKNIPTGKLPVSIPGLYDFGYGLTY
ncbi:beta-hexosaminidase [Paraliobacillus quinghaiensis]|uniref:beta-N-acetylhexosaminidase n=1 Tax=Paraliobacillus quinghaiensis TaxID=470815 RepID=A0A917TVT9_9BACI|nr:glycoside hydrolase family 3 protein [Paraliobacillus quinghaiensis]GGM38352.1 beta-hexosaminidase [Paraliobacillus quinghaiensis]